MKTFVIFLTLFVAALLLSGCAITHKFDPYFGKVVDAETMQPIEGAVVAMVYYSMQYGYPGGGGSRYADAQDTMTDANGEFRLPALRAYTFKVFGGWDDHPSVKIFKPGYGCFPEHKDAQPVFDEDLFTSHSMPANRYVTIKLPKLTTEKERCESTRCLSIPFETPYFKLKRFIDLVNEENKYLGLGIVTYGE